MTLEIWALVIIKLSYMQEREKITIYNNFFGKWLSVKEQRVGGGEQVEADFSVVKPFLFCVPISTTEI